MSNVALHGQEETQEDDESEIGVPCTLEFIKGDRETSYLHLVLCGRQILGGKTINISATGYLSLRGV